MSERPVLVLATANPGKVAELRGVLAERFDVVERPDHVADVAETADTLEGNAGLKAAAIGDATGSAALADDTGLEVEALGGEPGVHSARFAGPDADDEANVDLLLARLDGVTDRRARFRTVLVLRWPGGSSDLVVEGSVDGAITGERRGDHGFGYDPVFEPDDGDGRTFAEMTLDEKQAISHRGRAIRALLAAVGEDDS